jgi:tetratricopeptide (TPR) repeat protein
MGVVLIQLRQFDAAINDLRVRIESQPSDADTRFFLAEAYWLKGMARESAQELEAAYDADGDRRSATAIHNAFMQGGEKSVTTWQLNELKKLASKRYVSPWLLTQAYARTKDREQTLALLEKCYLEHSSRMVFLQNAPWLDFLHGEPRYQAIVQKMGLPSAY